MSKRALRLGGRHQAIALLVVRVERHDRVARRRLGEPPEPVDLRPQTLAAVEPVVGHAAGRHNVADPEVLGVRVVRDDERRVLGPQEARSPRPRHVRHREIRRQAILRPPLGGDHRPDARVEADKRPATDRDSRRRAGHHIMITCAVVPLVVADRPDDRELVGDRRQLRQVFRERDAGDLGVDGVERPPDLARGVGLGIERLVMARPAVHPDQDAACRTRPGRIRASGRQPRSRSRSMSPWPRNPPSPSRRQSRRLSPEFARRSRPMMVSSNSDISIFEQELGRVDQGPEQVLGRPATVNRPARGGGPRPGRARRLTGSGRTS